jgi:hypothetical protein
MAFQALLIMLILRPNLSRRGTLPLNERLRACRDLFASLQISMLIASRVEVFTEHVHVVEAVREQVAAPISRR